jgi:superfamily II DNA or RNA helicase
MNTNQLQQWKADVFGKYFSGVTIGEYNAKRKVDGDIVIVIIKSLIKLEQNYLKEFGLIIFDEIPEFMGTQTREAFWKTGAQYVLGLTATPDERLDGMDIFYKQLVGPLVRAVDIDGFNVEQIVWKGRVKTIRYTGPPQFTKTLTSVTNEMSCTMMNQQFSQDPYRCQLIYNYIVELYNAGKNVYIFATNREHLETMCNVVKSSGIQFTIEDDNSAPKGPINNSGPPAPKNSIVKTLMGGVADEEVVEAKAKSKIIFTTYSYGAVGMSIIKMDAIIFMTSRKNKMRQILGRILRRGGDPSIVRDIIDIVDYSTGIKTQYHKRKKIYEEKNFPIEIIDVDYSSITLKNFKL